MLHHLGPGQDLRCFTLAQRNHPVLVTGSAKLIFQFFNQNLELLPCFGSVLIRIPLADMDCPLALESNVHHHKLIIYPDNGSLDNIIHREVGFRFKPIIERV